MEKPVSEIVMKFLRELNEEICFPEVVIGIFISAILLGVFGFFAYRCIQGIKAVRFRSKSTNFY